MDIYNIIGWVIVANACPTIISIVGVNSYYPFWETFFSVWKIQLAVLVGLAIALPTLLLIIWLISH